MTALEYMEKQVQKHRRNLEREAARDVPTDMVHAILAKVHYYEAAVEALRERDALMAEIKDMCFLCRHYNSGKGNELCECCDDEDNFEWRGAQDNRLESNTDKVVDSDQFNRWISAEERLPEIEMHGTSRVVLAWEPDHGRCFAMVYDNGQGKRWFSGGVEIPNITHWMPLPEPPEVEV